MQKVNLLCHPKRSESYFSHGLIPQIWDQHSTEKMNLENNIRNGRKHMKLIMSSTNGFLEQPTSSNEQLVDRNRQLNLPR